MSPRLMDLQLCLEQCEILSRCVIDFYDDVADTNTYRK